MTLDTTARIGEVLALLIAAVKVSNTGLALRDTVRDLTRMIGSKNPPDGLIGDVEMLKVTAAQHREWLIAAGLDRRSGDERRDWRTP